MSDVATSKAQHNVALSNSTGQLSQFSYDELESLDEEHKHEVISLDLIEDKDTLIGVPFFITRITFRETELSTKEYVSVEAITSKNDRIVINDGSTGIRDQLLKYVVDVLQLFPQDALDDDVSLRDLDSFGDPDSTYQYFDSSGHWTYDIQLAIPLKCKRGLRRSDYGARTVNGTVIPAGTTYYLA